MRVATAHSYDSTVQTLNKRQAELSALQERISSGKRVQRASDDPVAAVMSEAAQNRLSRAQVDQRAIEASRTSLSQAETALGHAGELIHSVRELFLRAGNATYGGREYQNIAQARIEGAELEAMYDAGAWFVGLAGQIQRGRNVETGVGLVRVQPNRIVTTVGARFLDRKITAMVRWAAVASNDDLPAAYTPADSYNLVNVYVGYQPTPDVLMGLGIDNLLNQFYRPYPTAGQPDTVWSSPAPGITFKGSVKIRFGA